eukprot:154182_1
MIVIFALLHLLCLTVSYAMSYGSWQIGGSMPLPNHMMAVGYDATNETIWLVGGDADGSASQQLLAFDIVTQTSIEIRLQNQTRLSHSVWGNQFFTQIGNILWMINDVEKEYPNKAQGFSIFNVMTSQFIYDFNDIIVPVNTRELACLASTIDDNHNSYLFVVGGKLLDYSMDLTQIFNISSNTWLTNAPSMDTSRNAFSCIIHNDKLFSIGGHEHNVAPYYLDSIEVLDVSTANLHSFAVQWQYIDPLNMPRARTNAVAYMDKVLVIGGEPSGNPGGSSNAIHVIDTVSDTVTYYGDSLVTGLYHTASVVVNGALFVFGGQTDSIVDIWQYTVLPTPEPTTSNPTSIPSSNPTAMSYGSWQIGGSMPLRNHQMAVGYDATNDIIWLLGGSDEYNAKKQLLAFDVVTQTSVQLRQQNQTRLSHDIWGMQHFTQIDNILWMINAKTSPFATQGFSIFNVITSQFIYDYNGIIIPANTREMGCLASTTDNNDNAYLFVVGGQDADYNALSLTQIYNISSNEWLTNAPSMGTSRGAFSCIAHNHKLYSIGGWNYIAPYYLDSIEVLDVSTANLHSFTATWKYIDSLNKPRDSTNAVRYMDKVLAIGGGPSGNQGTASKEIHVIDTVSDTVTYYGESLAIAVYLTAPVVVNGTLFAFGGYAYGSGQASIQNWQYTVLPTPEPTTSNPTSIPTSNPTEIPTVLTKAPTALPTVPPTNFPTIAPIFLPTVHPSTQEPTSSNPTSIPSLNPTQIPTVLTQEPAVSPSMTSTVFPTGSPTTFPTKTPTLLPSNLPTVQPSIFPTIAPTLFPSTPPTIHPSSFPTSKPTPIPSSNPTRIPTAPTLLPSVFPTKAPTLVPSVQPTSTIAPTFLPSTSPTLQPSIFPTITPSSLATEHPTFVPTIVPTLFPSVALSVPPTELPSITPIVESIVVTDSSIWSENTTNTLSFAIDESDNDNIVSFVQRIAGNTEDILGLIAIISSGILCVFMGCVLFCTLRSKSKAKHVVHDNHESNPSLGMVPRQHTPTLTPPGVHMSDKSVSLPESTRDDATRVSIPMDCIEGINIIDTRPAKGEDMDDGAQEDMLNGVLDDVLRQESKDDSEQMYADPLHSKLKGWLTVNGFAHYLDNFVLFGGYYSLDCVKQIQGVQDLDDIGIKRKADQRLLMRAIKVQLCNAAIEDGEC